MCSDIPDWHVLKCRLACVKVQIGMCASVRSDALQSSFLAAHVVGDSRRTGFMIISCKLYINDVLTQCVAAARDILGVCA